MITYDNTTLHGSLKLRLSRHIYKKGAHKGDAPMDKRGKSHYRVIDYTDAFTPHMAVRFHNTDIIKAYPDGSITIDCDGYAGRPTTKTHLNEALPTRWGVWSKRLFSESQLVIGTPKGTFRYYDGITFDAEGTPTTELKPFLARRVDKEAIADLNHAIAESGFKEMFKILWGSAKPEDMHANSQWRWAQPETVVAADNAHLWQNIVAHFALEEKWTVDTAISSYIKIHTKHDAPDVWASIMRWLKREMFNTIETEVYSIQ